MKLFGYRRIGNKIKLRICGIKSSFHLLPKKNTYISLGTNCMPRMVLTYYFMKAKKKQGELSCPFDLCTTPLGSVIHFLENDFADFLNDIEEYNKDGILFKNKNFNISFVHENNLTLDEVKERYKKRIENFYKLSKEKSLKKYILTFAEPVVSVEELNKIYNLISIIRKDKPFEFHVCNFVKKISYETNCRSLNQKIIYKEIKVNDPSDFDWLDLDMNEVALSNL